MLLVFEDCVLDLDRRELRRASQPVAIAPQVFDLLVYLAENREREGAIGFLASFENTTGWRTGHVVDQLRSQWETPASLTGALPGGLLE